MIRSLPFAAALFLLVACPGAKPCTLHSDCPETERCRSGSCTLICRVDRDCEGLGSCIQGQCVLVVNGGGAGGSGGGGAAGGVAGGGTAGGGSAGGTAGGSAGGAAGGSAGGTAGGSAGGAAGGSAGGSAGGGAALGQLADPCTAASQCASNLCVGKTGMSGTCTISCASESVCPATWACLSVGGTNVCVPSDSGQSCNGSPSNCFAGVCVAGSVCATPCESTRACPSSSPFTCSPSAGVNGRICLPAGATCTASNQCVSNFCARKSVSPGDGVCTSVCRDRVDCPPGWACGLDDDGSGNTVSVCQPVGAACSINGSGMNDCYSQTCATPDDGGTSFCTALCMNPQLQPQPTRCPPNWTCAPVPVGTATWYACEAP